MNAVLAFPLIAASPALFTAFITAASVLIYKVLFAAPSIPKNVQIIEVDEKKAASNGSTANNVFPTMASALSAAFPRFKEAAFHITGKQPVVWAPHFIIPPKWIDYLKSLPDNQLSFMQAIDEQLNASLTHVTPRDKSHHEVLVKTVGTDLTRHIAKSIDLLDDEINYAFNKVLPPCEDWTEILPSAVIPEIVALASGRIFVGLPLCRDKGFVKSTVTFTIDSALAGEELHDYPKILRPYIAPYLKKVKTCAEQHATMQRLLKYELERRKAMVESGIQDLPADVMTWTIKNHAEKDRFDLAVHAEVQLGISLAAIHTTTMTLSNAWFDLAARQEYLEPLRNEWIEILADEQSKTISKASMPKLRKLDSFVKESQRMYPLGPTTFSRKVTSDIVLPDGTSIPKNSFISVAAQEIARDGSIWENPDKFDGFRFEKLRQQPGKENLYQFATTGHDSMFFGHGKHACPGRFFAANEIKLILAYIIRNYDMKYPEGEGRPAQIIRPSGNYPDPTKGILLKRRKQC